MKRIERDQIPIIGLSAHEWPGLSSKLPERGFLKPIILTTEDGLPRCRKDRLRDSPMIVKPKFVFGILSEN
jgi:hypothetical protein